MPVARSMGYVAGGTLRGRAALRDVLQGAVVPLADGHADHLDHAACRRRSRRWRPTRRTSSCSQGMSIHGGSPKTDGYQEEHAAGLIGCVDRQQLPLLEERLVLRVHRQRVDRHRDRQPLPDRAGAGGAPLRQPAHRGGRALRRRQRRPRPALHLVPQAAGGRLAVRQRHRADPGRRAGLRHADAAGERDLRARTRTSRRPTTPQLRAALRTQEEPDRLPPGRHRRRQARRSAWTRCTRRSSTAWSTAGARSRRRRTPSSRRSAPARAGGGRQAVPDGDAAHRQRAEQEQLRPAGAGRRPDDRAHQAGVRVGSHPRRRLHAVGRVERPPLAEPGRRQGAPHARAQQRRRRPEHHGRPTSPSKFALLSPRSRPSTTAAARPRSTTARSMLGMECWSDSSNGHYLKNIPFIFAGQGARRLHRPAASSTPAGAATTTS